MKSFNLKEMENKTGPSKSGDVPQKERYGRIFD